MDDETIRKAIQPMKSQVQELQRQMMEKMRTVNGLCAAVGDPPAYPEAELTTTSNNFGIQSDSYFGKPLATAARDILERRKSAGLGAAPLDVIFELMKLGGFRFDAKNDVNARRSLAITLSKNPAFIRLPGGDSIGLAEWYGDVRGRPATSAAKKESKTSTPEPAETDEDYTNDFAEDNEPEPAAADGQAGDPPRTRK